MLIMEATINKTEGHMIGEGEPYEPFTQELGKLYRALVKENGRCLGKVRLDFKDGSTHEIGWVFLKRAKYEDTGEPFLLETWVTLLEGPDTVTHKRHHFFMDRGRQELAAT